MSVRKRIWGKADKEAWIVDFCDVDKKRRLRTFKTRQEAERFHGITRAIGSGLVPAPLAKGYRPVEFDVPLSGRLKGQSNRAAIADALRAAHPKLNPTVESVIIHVVAEVPPRHVIADVDNLLKPVLDALKGVAWVDDTQVCELLVRRVPGHVSRLRIKLWQIPGPVFASLLNAFASMGHSATAIRPKVTSI
jgi:Holliday junction resolvase RusA-like endonuclease